MFRIFFLAENCSQDFVKRPEKKLKTIVVTYLFISLDYQIDFLNQSDCHFFPF